jgi:hypothetical protein
VAVLVIGALCRTSRPPASRDIQAQFRDEFHGGALLPRPRKKVLPASAGFFLAAGRQLACLLRRQREGCAALLAKRGEICRRRPAEIGHSPRLSSFSFIPIIVGRPPSAGSHHNPSMPVDELASSADQRKNLSSDAKTVRRGGRTLRS